MPSLPSLVRSLRRRDPSSDALISAFESETQAVFLRTRPYSEHAIMHALVAMVATAILLMSITKLDRVVTGPGRIVPSQGELYVQPLQKAIVRDIRVKVGDVVSKGQVLATLDPTFAAADLLQLQQKVASGRAEVARLEAEQSGETFRPAAGDHYQVLQQSIFNQRAGELRSSVADFDARIQNNLATITRLEQDAATYRQRLKIAADVEQMNVTLQQQGWSSKLKTMAAADNRMEMDRLLTQAVNQITESRHTVDALRAQRAAYLDRWRSETGKALVTARAALEEAEQELKKAEKLRELVNVEAPADAIVLKIGRVSIGSVAGNDATSTAEPLLTLARLDSPLEVELAIASQDIGFIQPGDPAEIKLDAYRFTKHGTARGEISTISEGTFATDENGQPSPPYFKARVALTDVNLRDVPATFRLIPGMTLTGDVLIGKRSIISYLVEGALRTGSEAMREP